MDVREAPSRDCSATTTDLHKDFYQDELTLKIGLNTRSIMDEVQRRSVEWPLVPLTQLHHEIAMSLFLKKYMTPLFDKALNDPSISAWGGYNDLIGLLALSYLAEKRMAPTLSVCSFDDSVQAISMGLTSYDFNIDSIVTSAMNHLSLYTGTSSGVHEEEIPGFVRVRPSTAVYRKR